MEPPDLCPTLQGRDTGPTEVGTLLLAFFWFLHASTLSLVPFSLPFFGFFTPQL